MFLKKIFYCILALMLISSCEQERNRLQIKYLFSKSLASSILKVNPEKKLAIYLPPSYFHSKKSFPVIYYLPGYTSPIDEIIGGEYEGFRLKQVMDELINDQKISEMIVVLCDGSNYLGGNFYVNSTLTGNAEDYIVQEIVKFIDSTYRTIPSHKSRGITGHSMGGFGAFNIASKHPEVFGSCYSISPGIYAESGLHDHSLFDEPKKLEFLENSIENLGFNGKNEIENVLELKKKIKPLFSISYESYLSAFTVAYGAAFNYNPAVPFPNITFPKKTTTSENANKGELLEWQNEGFGNWSIKVKNRKEKLLELNTVAFDCGLDDGWITEGVHHVLEILEAENIKVASFWHEGGHDNQLHLRLENHMLPFFSRYLKHEI